MNMVRRPLLPDLGFAPIYEALLLRGAIDRFHTFGRVPVQAPAGRTSSRRRRSHGWFRDYGRHTTCERKQPANDLRPVAAPAGRGKQRRLRSAFAILSVLGLAAYAFPFAAPDSMTARYVEQHQRTRAVELTDSRSRWLGVMPRSMLLERPTDPGTAPYATIEVSVPTTWIELLVALEDRNVRSLRSIHGIDVVSVGRAFLRLADGTEGGGGSSLVMQLARSMRGMDPSRGSMFAKLRRKVMELVEGAALYRRLGGIDSPEFQQYLARHLPLVIGARGSRMGTPLHGIGLASRVVWGIPPEEMDLAQQAVLAAAVKRPIVLAPDGDSAGLALRDARWHELKARAILGIRLALGDDPRGQQAIERVRRMPPPRPHLPIFQAANLGAEERFRLAANPELRASTLVPAELITAQGELLDRLGRTGFARVSSIRLSVDIERNIQFRGRVRVHLRRIESALGGRLLSSLTDRADQPAGADVLVALMHQGFVVALYSNSHEPLFNGALAERDADRRFVPERSGRQVASLGKVMLAVLFGRRDRGDTRYCNERLPNGSIHNADRGAGLNCHDPRAWHTARSVFGESMILPLIWRGRSVSKATLREMAQRYRLTLPADSEPHIALATGLATARPSDLAGMIQAVARGAGGRSAVAGYPSIVSATRSGRSSEWRSWTQKRTYFDLRQDFSPEVARFVREVLSAPLQDGTLSGLSHVRRSADVHVAKTGTTTTFDNQRSRDKYAVGAFHDRSGDWSYVVVVSARDASRGLGVRIPWSAFYPLLRDVLLEAPQPTLSRRSSSPDR